MSTELLFLLSCILLCLGWFFMVLHRRSSRLMRWRKTLAWVGSISLTVSILLFGLFLFWVNRAETTNEPFSSRLDLLLPIVRAGFWTATSAAIISCFGAGPSRVLFVISGLVIWLLWLAQATGI